MKTVTRYIRIVGNKRDGNVIYPCTFSKATEQNISFSKFEILLSTQPKKPMQNYLSQQFLNI